jgi:hypothetical protein
VAWVRAALLWREEPVGVGCCDFTAFVDAAEAARDWGRRKVLGRARCCDAELDVRVRADWGREFGGSIVGAVGSLKLGEVSRASDFLGDGG